MAHSLQAAFAKLNPLRLPGISPELQPLNLALKADLSALYLLDQTLLPNQIKYLELTSLAAYYDAIKRLAVRGAPAIGIFAAYAYFLVAQHSQAPNWSAFTESLKKAADYLNSARPTAVNLSWALQRMQTNYEKALNELGVLNNADPILATKTFAKEREQVLEKLLAAAQAIQKEDVYMCKKISEHALSLLPKGAGLLTHCNAGPLATSTYGTALGPILMGQSQGYAFHVFADETRPLLQGARLTSFELANANVDVTLICDNMAALVMRQGKVQACLVGTDRIAANGDIANKIGTSGVAILAKHYGIPFYVLGPSSTIDFNCATGEDIVIEERPSQEVAELFYEKRMAPTGINIYNPAFDVTTNDLITAIITEDGVFKAPYAKSLLAIKERLSKQEA